MKKQQLKKQPPSSSQQHLGGDENAPHQQQQQQMEAGTHGGNKTMPNARSLGSLATRPGRRYEPRRLPKLDGAASEGGSSRDDPAAAPAPAAKKQGKPEWDPRPLDWDTGAFPNYGGKSRSGLKMKRALAR